MTSGLLLVFSSFFLLFVSSVTADTATSYTFPSGGDSCRTHGIVSSSYDYDGGFCGAPDEDLFSSLGESGHCGQVPCSETNGNCDYCCNDVAGPDCPYNNICQPDSGQSAHYFCVQCAETSVCLHTDWVRIGVADACPSEHPCNVCKNINPCAAGRRHVDLCTNAFNNMFSGQVSDSENGGGNLIDISFNWQTDCPNPGRNYAGGSGGGGGGCTDVPPSSDYTCAQQAGWGQCSQSWMQGYCLQSCGQCSGSAVEDSTAVEPQSSTMNTPLIALIVLCCIGGILLVVLVVLILKKPNTAEHY